MNFKDKNMPEKSSSYVPSVLLLTMFRIACSLLGHMLDMKSTHVVNLQQKNMNKLST